MKLFGFHISVSSESDVVHSLKSKLDLANEKNFELECSIDSLEDDINNLNKKIINLNSEISGLKKAQDTKLNEITREHSIIIDNLKATHETKIIEETNSLKKELLKVSSEKEIAEAKASMLEKAFGEIGFDVKDMKSMFDKLIDGIVKKNEVNLIKTK